MQLARNVLTPITKSWLLSANRIGTKLSDETRARISATTAANIGVTVLVKNIQTGETLEYVTITEVGAAFNVSRTTVKNYIKSGRDSLLRKQKYLENAILFATNRGFYSVRGIKPKPK